jgi:ABC-type multidrug transport system fused ATPase/permease subunit
MFTSHKFEKKYLFTQTEKAALSDQNMLWFMLKLRYGLGISCTIMIAAIVYYIVSLRKQNIITIGQCVLVITLCIVITEDIWDLTKEFGDVFEQIGVFSQTISLIQKYTITDVENAQKLIIKQPSIEFQNVTFYYQNQDNIFKNKSVKIDAYQKVGLAGFSGSGKTTFTNLITRLFDIEEGRILIDGQDIKLITQDSLRRNISIIPQEPILFHRSIIENIKYGTESATFEEVVAAAKSAYIHDFINKLPDGYNTLCGERGNNLSGGQRQRIIIARAILKNAPILILDEATSTLDNLTENLIQRSLKTLMKGKTVLVIAHRLSTLLNMDRILVFDNGHIVEDGIHNELKTNGKLYQQLWNAQKGGSIAELY